MFFKLATASVPRAGAPRVLDCDSNFKKADTPPGLFAHAGFRQRPFRAWRDHTRMMAASFNPGDRRLAYATAPPFPFFVQWRKYSPAFWAALDCGVEAQIPMSQNGNQLPLGRMFSSSVTGILSQSLLGCAGPMPVRRAIPSTGKAEVM